MRIGDPQIVGEMMRARRKQMGFTIAEMAEAVGLSPITILRLELGRTSYIHEKTAKALEVPTKIINRMVMVPTAVTQEGQNVALPPLTALLKRPSLTGDVVASQTLPMTTQKRKPNRIQNASLKAEELSRPAHGSIRKKFLMWLSSEFERMAS